ncbi:response regulator transcription factor [Niallia alba]|uniref:response regulator transcription factor n=1 Tax=Niallia alba TaxID=2729105 RepID=UPI0028FFD94C|nr:response regulator transcription factor [Niallia nealsonii]
MQTLTECRILIVDDEVLIRQGIKHYLDWNKEGFEIVGEASNGKEALGLIKETNPHIILTDIVMPIMDGEELTRIVKEQYPAIEIIILSSFSEYEYVRSTFQSGVVDYILKPKLDSEELLKVLKRAVRKLPNFSIQLQEKTADIMIPKLIEKMISGYEMTADRNIICKELPYSHYYLLGGYLLDEKDQSIDKDSFQSIFTNIKNVVSYVIPIDKNNVLYLINFDKTQEVTMEKKIQYEVSQQTQKNVFLVISDAYTDFFLTGEIFKNSIYKQLNYHFYFPDKKLLTTEEWMKDFPKKIQFNLEWFTNEWKDKRFDTALDYLTEYVERLTTYYVMEISEFKAFFSSIIFNITIMLTNLEYDLKGLEEERYNYFQKIDMASTAQETVHHFNGFMDKVHACLEANKKPAFSTNMKRLIEYIEQHFSDSLTLTDLARHFHFNPSYLSSYFTTHYKESFIEFLNRVRIEEATKLLKNRDYSIAEISGLVGYTDHSYFCKVFKKHKGMSPSKYRRKMTV